MYRNLVQKSGWRVQFSRKQQEEWETTGRTRRSIYQPSGTRVETPSIPSAAYIYGRGIIGEWTEHLGLSCFRTKSLFDILISLEVLCVRWLFRGTYRPI